MAGLVTKLRELGTEVTDEALADVATVSAGNNRVVRHWFRSVLARSGFSAGWLYACSRYDCSGGCDRERHQHAHHKEAQHS